MANVFKEEIWTYIPAKSHSSDAYYYVAIGSEQWENDRIETVVKVQMAYFGTNRDRQGRDGRKAPSYPLNSDDWFKVSRTVEFLMDRFKEGAKGELKIHNAFL